MYKLYRYTYQIFIYKRGSILRGEIWHVMQWLFAYSVLSSWGVSFCLIVYQINIISSLVVWSYVALGYILFWINCVLHMSPFWRFTKDSKPHFSPGTCIYVTCAWYYYKGMLVYGNPKQRKEWHLGIMNPHVNITTLFFCGQWSIKVPSNILNAWFHHFLNCQRRSILTFKTPFKM